MVDYIFHFTFEIFNKKNGNPCGVVGRSRVPEGYTLEYRIIVAPGLLIFRFFSTQDIFIPTPPPPPYYYFSVIFAPIFECK